jgi:spermidine dehydrogenase
MPPPPNPETAGGPPAITRRDFLNGVALSLAGGTTLSPAEVLAQDTSRHGPGAYPPALTGLRGAHPGSFEAAHALAWEHRRWPAPVAANDGLYDLVVVGGGLSGLSAAWFYRQAAGPAARILILDNHDDFGGHAKRNEFTVDGRTLIGYGGSQSIDTPSRYSAIAMGLLRSLGVEVERFYKYFDRAFYTRRNLGAGLYFDRAHYGEDRTVGNPFRDAGAAAAIDQFPIAPQARAALSRLLSSPQDPLVGRDDDAKLRYLRRTSYETFLIQDWQLPLEAALILRNSMVGFWGVGWDTVSANQARLYGMPGTRQIRFAAPPEGTGRDDPYIFHFPDGNAAIARLLVRSLIPTSAPGTTMEDVVTARFLYDQLDHGASPVRLRLNSTAIGVRHNGDGHSVDVTYVRDDTAYQIRGRHAVLACYNRMIPYLCPELPSAQRAAIEYAEKIPLVYVNVALRNWRAFAAAGVSRLYAPQAMFAETSLDFPVSVGGYEFSRDPEQPIVVHMAHVPTAPGQGLDERAQHRIGRQRLYTTSFAEFETAIGGQLAGALGAHGFDAERDIAAITVNRWPHGYAYEYNELYDPEGWSPAIGPHVIGRAQLGRISIANSDAEAHAYADAAIDAAYRAVREQLMLRP